jgi:hypothetical protein
MENNKKKNLQKALSTTITVASLMELLSQYDGRFPVCFVDKKNNMMSVTIDDICMTNINILLPSHTHIFDIPAIVITHE